MSNVVELGRTVGTSKAQRLRSLERANGVRLPRAALKREMKAGTVTGLAVLLDPPACMESIRLFEMLMAMPKVGRVKANRILAQCRISPAKTVGGLSPRQRDEIAGLLRSPC